MKKHKALRASFVISFGLAGTALLGGATGCVGVTNPPEPYCPESVPAEGTDCDNLGLAFKCTYEGDACGSEISAICQNDQWSVTYPAISCNPPPVLSCPEELPLQGGSCFGEGSCDYTDDCGLAVTVTCPSGSYEVSSEGTCNPPAPCDAYDTEEGCSGAPSCRWLTPGCAAEGQTALPAAGCFPADPCVDPAQCDPDQSCQEVMVAVTCAGDDCTCGAATSLCLALPQD